LVELLIAPTGHRIASASPDFLDVALLALRSQLYLPAVQACCLAS